jgi:hypothetical protein
MTVWPLNTPRQKTSLKPFESPATRFAAKLRNATREPSAEIALKSLQPSDWIPAVETLTRRVT